MGRIVPQAGLSYYDANMGTLVTEGPDVCDYKSRLREIDPSLSAYYDIHQEEWIVTWWDEKTNQDTFLLNDKDLGSAYERTLRARNDRPGALTAEELDDKLVREQEEHREQEMKAFKEIAGDAGERLIHAFKKDHFEWDDDNGVKPKPHLSHRASVTRTFR